MKVKTRKSRLPKGVVAKLSTNTGGGRHKKKKGKSWYERRAKHQKDEGPSFL